MKEKNKRIKLLELLLLNGQAAHEDEARALIMAGQVIVNDQRVDKPGLLVSPNAELRIKGRGLYVSRGGDKLAGVIEDLNLASRFKDAVVLDVGSSTGGFTDCVLKLGASLVYALDVGKNQLAWKLRSHSRVKSLERTDIRSLTTCLDENISAVVADVSFTSLSSILPAILTASPSKGVCFLLLIKPQFELDPHQVPEGGVVRDNDLRQEAVKKVTAKLALLNFKDPIVIDSRLAGKSGNLELFLYFEN